MQNQKIVFLLFGKVAEELKIYLNTMLVLKKIKKQWRLFPIGSPKGALNHKRKPEFVGNIKFSNDGDSLSISRFVADYNLKDNSTLNEKLVPPGEVIKLLRSQAVFLATPDEKVENYERGFITKQLIELMGGRILVHTVFGQGSKFTVVINQKIEKDEVIETKSVKTTLRK